MSPLSEWRVRVLGAGVFGLACAAELQAQGISVEIWDRAAALSGKTCSWLAGGMLAAGCEAESAPPPVVLAAAGCAEWWERQGVPVIRRGSLVLAAPRDQGELPRFLRQSQGGVRVEGAALAALEPALADKHTQGIFYPEEAHLDPRQALSILAARLSVQWGRVGSSDDLSRVDLLIDARGIRARPEVADLRGVRGEMLLLRCTEIDLTRPVRLLHPRFPCYLVPRGEGVYMLGATMVESNDPKPITARAVLDLLSGLWALHPGFAEAEIMETGAHVRPAFANNIPQVRRDGRVIRVNGAYRHGFLLAPYVARQVAALVREEIIACA
jgi:glycine oxidase